MCTLAIYRSRYVFLQYFSGEGKPDVERRGRCGQQRAAAVEGVALGCTRQAEVEAAATGGTATASGGGKGEREGEEDGLERGLSKQRQAGRRREQRDSAVVRVRRGTEEGRRAGDEIR